MEKLSGAAKPEPESTPSGKNAEPSSASVTAVPAAPQAAEPPAKPKISVRPANQTLATSENPSTKLSARSSNGANTLPVRHISEKGSLKRPRAESDGQNNTRATSLKAARPSADEDIDTYENRILGQIFRVTLDPEKRVDASNHKLIYLPNLKQELEEEEAPVRLSKDRLDSAILEACSTIPHNKPVLDYLLPCWKRITKTMKGLRGYSNAKDAIVKEARRLCLSNCVFAVEIPQLFG